MTNEYLCSEETRRLIGTPKRLGNFSVNEKFPSKRKRYKNSRREVSAVFVLF